MVIESNIEGCPISWLERLNRAKFKGWRHAARIFEED